MTLSSPRVVSIAGSDPSGGAGIQADLRTISALGAVGLSALSALTVQNSHGVKEVHPVCAELLAAQIEALFSDAAVDAVKIGMLGAAAQVETVAAALDRYRPVFVVIDPVLASTGGVPLLSDAGMRALIDRLLPRVTVITPNVPELARLTGMPVESEEERIRAGRMLIARGAAAVLIKGGHLIGNPTDLLIVGDGAPRRFDADRFDTPHTHGTGCLFASALAALLARGHSIEQAVGEAKRVLTAALRFPTRPGAGIGYPDALRAVREGAAMSVETHVQRLRQLRGIYVLTDSDLRPDRSAFDMIHTAAAGGASTVQLREKRLSTPDLIDLAKSCRELARELGLLFIVNDRVDVAMACDADGVHLGPDDMHPADARRMMGPERLIGVSVNSVEEARPAADYVSYFGVGAIFGSRTKLDAGAAIGTEPIREIKRAFPDHPLVAIGGIGLGNIAEVAAAGADAAAVVSAVIAAPDMAEAVRELAARFGVAVGGAQ